MTWARPGGDPCRDGRRTTDSVGGDDKADFGITVSHYLLVDFDASGRWWTPSAGSAWTSPPAARRQRPRQQRPAGHHPRLPAAGRRPGPGPQPLLPVPGGRRPLACRPRPRPRPHPPPAGPAAGPGRPGAAAGLTDPLRAGAVLSAVAGRLTRGDTLTVTRAVRLAGQFRQFRPGALTGLTSRPCPPVYHRQMANHPQPRRASRPAPRASANSSARTGPNASTASSCSTG